MLPSVRIQNDAITTNNLNLLFFANKIIIILLKYKFITVILYYDKRLLIYEQIVAHDNLIWVVNTNTLANDFSLMIIAHENVG